MIDVHSLSYLTWAAIAFGGMVIHLFIDWFLQNDWMAQNKVNPRHPAGYVHAASHAIGLLLLFPWWAALLVGVIHFLIDLRSPLTWWKKVFRQTREGDIAMHVGVWSDQVAHMVVIALVAILLV